MEWSPALFSFPGFLSVSPTLRAAFPCVFNKRADGGERDRRGRVPARRSGWVRWRWRCGQELTMVKARSTRRTAICEPKRDLFY